MLDRTRGPETVVALIVIGGHLATAALIAKQIREAIYVSLAVALITIIFISLHLLLTALVKQSNPRPSQRDRRIEQAENSSLMVTKLKKE